MRRHDHFTCAVLSLLCLACYFLVLILLLWRYPQCDWTRWIIKEFGYTGACYA